MLNLILQLDRHGSESNKIIIILRYTIDAKSNKFDLCLKIWPNKRTMKHANNQKKTENGYY